MREQARHQVRRNEPNPFATREDFIKVFHEDMNGLYQLSFLLSGDHEKAEKCLVAGIEDCVKENRVFREWARSWAKRIIVENAIRESHLRLRLSPKVTIAMGMMTLRPDAEGLALQSGEMVASHSPRADDMDAYERVLEAAMAGDSTLFARGDYVEEAWRIVEPVLKKRTPVYPYAPNSLVPRKSIA